MVRGVVLGGLLRRRVLLLHHWVLVVGGGALRRHAKAISVLGGGPAVLLLHRQLLGRCWRKPAGAPLCSWREGVGHIKRWRRGGAKCEWAVTHAWRVLVLLKINKHLLVNLCAIMRGSRPGR